MPKMDGIELVRRVRETNPDLKVIFMTGYANLNSAKEAIRHGALEYIMKPFELTEIRQAVHRAVDKIQHEAETSGNNPNEQLERLSDLNQMLYQAGDRKSLTMLSLKFANMHCHSKRGAALCWSGDVDDVSMTTIVNDGSEELDLPNEPLQTSLANLTSGTMSRPFHVTTLEEHPLYKATPDPELARFLIPEKLNGCASILNIPIARAETVYGLIMVGLEEDSPTLSEADMRFVSITSSQLALSLENVVLLEEAQNAYTRLKELQDETIELEKMATRGEMSAEIGHELNNFLGVISGNVSLLGYNLNKKKYDQLGRYVKSIEDNIGKVKKFTSNLMDLTPISSKKEVIDFAAQLDEVVDYLRPQGRYSGVEITLQGTGEPVPFEADSVHIQQLLYNIFNNAADATLDQKRREIDVGLTVSNDDSTFTISITDTGVGIEPALLEKAFSEKFTTKKTGHGFGLLVCQRVIDSHAGKLDIDSVVGKGTTIKITFPIAQTEAKACETLKIPIQVAEPVTG
jgi:signal transduction histidine kinase